MLELFILKRKIKGPCWLTIKDPQRVINIDQKRSWSRHEIKVEDPKSVICSIDDINK